MASAYGSTVFSHRGAEVAARVGDFGGHESAAPELQAVVEDGRPGDAVGSVCTVTSRGVIRGRLLAHSAPNHLHRTASPASRRARFGTTRPPGGVTRMAKRFRSSSAGWLHALRETPAAEER